MEERRRQGGEEEGVRGDGRLGEREGKGEDGGEAEAEGDKLL